MFGKRALFSYLIVHKKEQYISYSMVSDIPDLQITWLAPFGMLLSDTQLLAAIHHTILLLIMGALSPSVIGAAESHFKIRL